MGIKISDLNPTINPSRNAILPVVNDGQTLRYSIDQVMGLLEFNDLPTINAEDIAFDPSTFGITSTDVQGAIDEIVSSLGTAASADVGTGPNDIPTNSLLSDSVSRGYIFGLTVSNNTTDANNDIDIAAGEAASDATSPILMTLASALTKRLDAAWAAGDGQGGLDTGSKANSTWYHVWLISRSDTGVTDVLFSTSVTSPIMPANYDRKRRIGAVRTNGIGNIIAFVQSGDRFEWITPINDVVDLALTNNPKIWSLSVPSGVSVIALLNGAMSGPNTTNHLYIFPTDITSAAPLSGAAGTPQPIASSGSAGQINAFICEIRTNLSSQVAAAAGGNDPTSAKSVWLTTRGWIDTRGRLG